MKILSLFAITLLYSVSASAQTDNQIYGKAVYKYKFNFSAATKDTLKGTLYFNSLGESFYTTPLFVNVARKNEFESENNREGEQHYTDSLVVYRNLVKNEQLYSRHENLSRGLIKDTVRIINWVYESEIRKIGRFTCNSATGKISGRIYKVWYTTEVPVSTGPWKLYGLPGLIIEAYDDSDMVSFQLFKLEIGLDSKKVFNLEKLQQVAISPAQYEEKKKKDLDKIRAHAESMGVKFTYKVISRGIELEN